MEREIFIGCDIGTSGAKAVAADVNGNILAQSAVTYGIIQPRNNWAEQDPQVWLDAAVQTIRRTASQIPSASCIKGICISALYGGTGVLCDKDMNSLRPPLIWMDHAPKQKAEKSQIPLEPKKFFKSLETESTPISDIPNYYGLKNTNQSYGKRYGTSSPFTATSFSK